MDAIYEVIRVAQLAKDVTKDDLITISQAVELSGKSQQVIGDRLDTGTMRWFQRSDEVSRGRGRVFAESQRLVLRSEALALKQERSRSRARTTKAKSK